MTDDARPLRGGRLDGILVAAGFTCVLLAAAGLGVVNNGLTMESPVVGSDGAFQPTIGPAYVPITCVAFVVGWGMLGLRQRPGPPVSVRHLVAGAVAIGGWLVGELLVLAALSFGSCSGAPCDEGPTGLVLLVVGAPVLAAAMTSVALAVLARNARWFLSGLPGLVLTCALVAQHALWRTDLFAS